MFDLEILQDILAAIGVVLNGIPQGLLALSYGFASVPTAIGFAVGAVSCGALNSVAPISFQAETIVMAGSMGKTRRAGRTNKMGRRADWKKAVVTLSEGSIEII